MRIGIIAGEASGDLLGAGLIKAIKVRIPDVAIEGIAGPRMREQGCKVLFPSEKLAVMGLVEVIGHYRELLDIRTQVLHYFLANPPDVFIGVDAPDFNLGLARRLKRAGIPTVQYVSPQVWAWRQYRVRNIARCADLMLTLFPFEASFYEGQAKYRIATQFVGHPLADMIAPGLDDDDVERQNLRRSLGVPPGAELVALMPGSRASELRYLAESFVRTAAWCRERRPSLHFIAPQANKITRNLFEQVLSRCAPDLPVVVLEGRAHEALRAADAVLVASGTATLEALLLKRPMVVAYRMAAVTYWITRRLLKVPYFSLPNLLAGRKLVEEFSQEEVTVENMGKALLAFFEKPEAARGLRETFENIHQALRQGADDRAAETVLALIRSGDSNNEHPDRHNPADYPACRR